MIKSQIKAKAEDRKPLALVEYFDLKTLVDSGNSFMLPFPVCLSFDNKILICRLSGFLNLCNGTEETLDSGDLLQIRKAKGRPGQARYPFHP